MEQAMEMMASADEVLFPNYGKRDLAFVRGEGAYVYDRDDRRFLDFTAGIAVCNLGHAHPGLASVIAEQAKTLLHTSNLFLIEGQVALANKLVRLVSAGTPYRAMFVNSGTEANEGALKLARRYQFVSGQPQKTRVIGLPNGFHGRTMGALSVTANAKYREGMAPLVPGLETATSYEAVIDAIDDTVAACIVEVIQGEAGVRPVDREFLQRLAARLRETGGLLIVDEVQTGVGRTGTFLDLNSSVLNRTLSPWQKAWATEFPREPSSQRRRSLLRSHLVCMDRPLAATRLRWLLQITWSTRFRIRRS
ncbi:hypothetical protein GCM10025858_32080 [Alicyclobacillus sacchari]|nr:hypothetical protein GCM10025858_32080 [Alicyclobacillus sacchari]